MSDPLQMWSGRLADAQSDEARRALLVELSLWRAKNLNNTNGMRRATYTVARIHQQLGQTGLATNEARSLVSLYRTPPAASDEEVAAMNALMRSLGMPEIASAPKVSGGRPGRERREGRRTREPRERRPRGEGPPASPKGRERSSSLDQAREAAIEGRYDDAVKALAQSKGAIAMVIRAYADLSAALAGPEADRPAKLLALQESLARGGGLRTSAAARGDDPLSKLLGEAVPSRRALRLRAMDAFAAAHPDQIDALAEAALKHHLGAFGKDAPAPWLVGVVGRALATTDAVATRAAIAELREAKSLAVAAYDEWPFERLLRATARAATSGFELGPMRRGVLAREEPDDRKLWTLRLRHEGVERMLTVAPHATDTYPPGKAQMLASRLLALSPRTLLLATGSGNAELRECAAAEGITVQELDCDDDALLAALRATGHANAQGSPPERLSEALQAEVFDGEAVRRAVADFRRPDRSLRPILRLELDDERTAGLLGAVHEAVEPGLSIPEGTTLAIRMAAHGPKTRSLLLDSPASARFGGPGIAVVVDLVRILLDDGWHLHRVLLGPTRRESRLHPAVETLSGSMGGLWRVLVRRGDQRGEVWYVAELPIEGRAAVPLLLLEDHARAVVLSPDADLATWWSTVSGAPTGIPWATADDVATAAAVREAVGRFPAVPMPAGGGRSGAVAAAPVADAAPPTPVATELDLALSVPAATDGGAEVPTPGPTDVGVEPATSDSPSPSGPSES